MADLIEIKIGFLLIIYLFGLAGGILPWVMSKETSHDRFLAMGDTFAGGVLVGAGLIHLLSSGVEDFKLVVPNSNYPITYLLAGAGFFLILLLEGVIAKERSSDDAVNLPQPVTWGAQLGTILVSLSKGHAYAYVLLLVLSVHSIIEGLTLGAQQSFIGSLVVFIAIIAHKSLAGFALGVSFHRLGLVRSRAVPLIMFFAVMTPIGIIFGTIASDLLSHYDAILFEAIFNSIAAGTFIYIATFDIIRDEFNSPLDRWPKWLLAVVGFGIMALLAIWI